MPRPKKSNIQLTAAEQAAQVKLEAWIDEKYGRGLALSQKTGINVATVSRMKNGLMRICLEAAIRIELATGRALRAETLCPSMASTIKRFRNKKGEPV